MAVTLSDEANYIVRHLQAALKQLDEHRSASERQFVYDFIARHVRNASPMSMSALPDPVIAPVAVTPETHIRRDLGDGAGYDIAIADDFLRLTFLDVTGDNAMHHFERAGAREFVRDVERVLAAMASAGVR